MIEPWYGGSHEAWADGYARTSSFDIAPLTLPATGWRRRLRSAGAELASLTNDRVSGDGRPDVILASSMMNLDQYRSQLRSDLRNIPVALYMHENQLNYDASAIDAEFASASIDSVLAADRVMFNSDYHRSSFFAAWEQLEASGRPAESRNKCSIVPVGIDAKSLSTANHGLRRDSLIVWNHRWEFDKDPASFREALALLEHDSWEVALLGDGAADSAIAATIAERHGGRVVHRGWLPRTDYLAMLHAAGIVVSTAKQEFFGIAAAEAIAAGASPVLPDRLAYPELLPPQKRWLLYSEPTPVEALERALTQPPSHADRAELQEWVGQFDWSLVAPRLNRLLEELAL